MFMPSFIGCVSPCFNIVILSVKFVIYALNDAIDLSDDAVVALACGIGVVRSVVRLDDASGECLFLYCPFYRTLFLTTLLTTNICFFMLFFACFCMRIFARKIEKSLENTGFSVLSRLLASWRRVRDSNTYLPVGIARSAVF